MANKEKVIMEMKNLMIGVVLVTVVALAFSGLIGNAAWRYGETYDSTFLNETLGNTSEWMSLQSDMTETINQDPGVDDDDPDKVGKYLGQGIETVKFAGTAVIIFQGFVTASASVMHVPDYIVYAMIIIVLAGIVLGALAAVFTGRVKP